MGAPIVLQKIPTLGLGGERDNVQAMLMVVASLLPRGVVLLVDVAHDSACPVVEDETLGMPACLCEHVDLVLRKKED